MQRVLLKLGLVLLAIAGAVMAAGAALAQSGPEDALRAHFDAITAKDYSMADACFSAAFLRSFKADVAKLNMYYLVRQEQLGRGYSFVESQALDDPGRETAVVVVEFHDPFPDARVQVTERMYYYLVREKAAPGSPVRDPQGMAWRIDIFDQLRYDSLADARRRAYLYSKDSWADDQTREMKSRQGLFRIQWALDRFATDTGQYPLRLLGGDNRRDELLSRQILKNAYPPNGYDNRAIKAVDLGAKSSGDISYFSLDRDGDGRLDGYWLLLHGKDAKRFYFTGLDTVYILSDRLDLSQLELAQAFAQYWLEQTGDELLVTQAPEPLIPFGAMLAEPAMPDAAGETAQLAQDGIAGAEGAVDESSQAAAAELFDPAQAPSQAQPEVIAPADPGGAEQALPQDAVAGSGKPASAAAPSLADVITARATELMHSMLAHAQSTGAAEPSQADIEELLVYCYGF